MAQLPTLRLGRCPHCGVANPLLAQVWTGRTTPSNSRTETAWAAFACMSCGGVVTSRGFPGGYLDLDRALFVYPSPKAAHEDVPEPAHTFLQQAFDTLHAPDAAAVMAGSAVDAMLKAHGLNDGTVYARIEEAVEQRILTAGMAQWAHSVRLGANRPRHADAEKPHLTRDEAARSVEFAEALGYFLFVLKAQIDRGIEAADKAG